MEGDDRASCVAALQAGIDAGMTHIDTAELYGWGKVEELVADALEGRRDQVFLASKVHPKNASRSKTVRACEQSLQRLRTDHLDLYLIHWRQDHPLAETFAALEELVQAGKIRAFGVSNFDVPDLRESLKLVGPGKLACNQVLYHLEQRGIEHAVIPWCRDNGVPIVGYSPFAVGRFVEADGEGAQVLGEIARAHGVTARQVALRFLLRDPIAFTIPKASKAAHVRDNAAAGELKLTEEDLRRINAAFPLARSTRNLPML